MIAEITLEAALVADAALTPQLDAIAAGWASEGRPEGIVEQLEVARRACVSGIPPDW